MDREGIRRLAAEELGIKTSPYLFAENEIEFRNAVDSIGIPCVVKPVMSSSGKGQSVIRQEKDIAKAWVYSQEGGRISGGRIIVEKFIDFDYEITLLTVRHSGGTSFCDPVGHIQIDGDYRESWQPQAMTPEALAEAQNIGRKITDKMGGRGLLGVELVIKGEEVFFSEVSPRPHDTGMVTMISQDLSEFALHARAVLGLPIPAIRQFGPSASCALLVEGTSRQVSFSGLDEALAGEDIHIRLFGKPEVKGKRRMGVILARDESIEKARLKARKAAESIKVQL
jgi:phosphoribosylglycinamide formyltransferase 2